MTITIVPRELKTFTEHCSRENSNCGHAGRFIECLVDTHDTPSGIIRDTRAGYGSLKSMSGVVVVEIETRDAANAWQILSGFIGFLDRYFKNQISSINIHYVDKD
jgi:hypothetical protein